MPAPVGLSIASSQQAAAGPARQSQRAASDTTREIVFVNVPGGRYGFQVSGLPQNAYVSDIRTGGLSVYDNGLEIGPDPPQPIEVIVNTDASSIEGSVLGLKQPSTPAATVVLVPQSRRQNSAL